MTPWAGWSTSPAQVQLTRVLGAILSSVVEGQPSATIAAAIRTAGCTADAAQVSDQLIRQAGLLRPANSSDIGYNRHLQLTPAGRQVAAQFRAADESLAQAGGARRAILQWCHDQPAVTFLAVTDISQHPHGWFWGRPFSASVMAGAADTLCEQGLLFVIGPSKHRLVQLTAAGVHWVQVHNIHLEH